MQFSRFMLSSCVVMAALGSAPTAASDVVLYSSNNVEVVNRIVDLFKAKHPDVDVSVVRAGTGALMQRIKAEATNPLGDIFWSGGFSTLADYKDYLDPYQSPQAGAVGEAFRGPDDAWLGTNTHVSVLMVNERQLGGQKPPQSWADLADPRWKGKIVIPDPQRSSSSYVALFGLNKLMGPEVFKQIVDNAVIVGTTAGAYDGVAKGEFPVGVTMEYAAYQYVDGGMDAIALVYPREGTFLSNEGMALIKGGKNPAQAKLLFDFLASAPVQTEIFKSAFRRPLRTDIPVEQLTSLPAMANIEIFALSDEQMGNEREAFLEQWRTLMANR